MSRPSRQFSLTLDALAALSAENKTPPSQPIRVSSTLNRVFSEIGPFPHGTLFLGMAADGLPVLLNLHDPVPGAVLITSDRNAGKVVFLQFIANTAAVTHGSNDLQFVIITTKGNDWGVVEATPQCIGVFSPDDPNTKELLLSLVSWAHANKRSEQSVLLLVDDLESAAKMDPVAIQNFRWLLSRGPSRRVWPIVALEAERYGQVFAWIPNFRTRIFGRIMSEQAASALGGEKAAALDQLDGQYQFSLRENGQWLQFYLPD